MPTMLDFTKWSGGGQFVLMEDIQGNVRYIGMSELAGADTAAPIWKIYREAQISVSVVRTEWALNNPGAIHIWDNRVDYFSPLLPINDPLNSPNKGEDYTLIDAVSMGSSIVGDAFDASGFSNWSVQFVWTGTPTGTVAVETSNNGTNYSTITGTSQATAGATGSHTVNFSGNGQKYIRPIYTRSSSTGTLTATAVGN